MLGDPYRSLDHHDRIVFTATENLLKSSQAGGKYHWVEVRFPARPEKSCGRAGSPRTVFRSRGHGARERIAMVSREAIHSRIVATAGPRSQRRQRVGTGCRSASTTDLPFSGTGPRPSTPGRGGPLSGGGR